jgi:hypothetical protein
MLSINPELLEYLTIVVAFDIAYDFNLFKNIVLCEQYFSLEFINQH